MANNNTRQHTFKPRESKDQQMVLRYDNSPLYSLDKVHLLDWKLFMWFASLKKVENYVYLFIVIWDAIDGDDEFFKDEITSMIQIIEGLEGKHTNYFKILNDYKNTRNYHNQAKNLVENSWAELERYGLSGFSHAVQEQLRRCSYKHIKELRKMVISRMSSFQVFAGQIKDNNASILKENETLKNQITNLKKGNSQQDNQELLKIENENLKVQLSDLMKERDDQEFLKRENERLRNQVTDLIRENSQHQAALGNLTNVSWNDDDPHNSKKLIKDITDLQDMLSDFTMVQGSDFKIIDETAAVLLKARECEVDYPSSRANLVLGFLLQRIAINTIITTAEKYLNGPSENQITALERNIVYTTDSLIKQTLLFKDIRKGEDDITKITPIKIRQHVYSALSCRGLPYDHLLIKDTANKLLIEMNKYRLVVDKETKDELDDLAIQITHKVINIFCFRLKTQATVPTYQFFDAGQAVEPHLMQGPFGIDEYKKLVVEACGFPCIGIFNGDKSSNKIFMKAQIIQRQKK
jgi:hypothetical protein